MKTPLPFWFIGLALLAAADSSWCTSNSCCLPQDVATQKDDDGTVGSPTKQRESLGKLQAYVGQWRGVGQPKRGSTKDSWVERSGWAWQFGTGDVSLQLISEDGKFLRSAKLRATSKPGDYELTATTATGAELKYSGTLTQDGLVLLASQDVEGAPSRITIRLVADGDRMVVLYERKADAERYTRLAEVGMTRQGSGFGKGTTYVECVVTGGLGTIAVMHEGKTYYVCCTGCRDYFNDNPAEVLAEYRARKAAEKAKK